MDLLKKQIKRIIDVHQEVLQIFFIKNSSIFIAARVLFTFQLFMHIYNNILFMDKKTRLSQSLERSQQHQIKYEGQAISQTMQLKTHRSESNFKNPQHPEALELIQEEEAYQIRKDLLKMRDQQIKYINREQNAIKELKYQTKEAKAKFDTAFQEFENSLDDDELERERLANVMDHCQEIWIAYQQSLSLREALLVRMRISLSEGRSMFDPWNRPQQSPKRKLTKSQEARQREKEALETELKEAKFAAREALYKMFECDERLLAAIGQIEYKAIKLQFDQIQAEYDTKQRRADQLLIRLLEFEGIEGWEELRDMVQKP